MRPNGVDVGHVAVGIVVGRSVGGGVGGLFEDGAHYRSWGRDKQRGMEPWRGTWGLPEIGGTLK